jgi:hypothetical protein
MTTVQKTTRRRCSARVSVPFLTALAAAGILAGCSKDPAEEANTADTAIVDTFVNAADCVASERYDQATCDRLEALGRFRLREPGEALRYVGRLSARYPK